MNTESKPVNPSKEIKTTPDNSDSSKGTGPIPLLIGLNGFKGVGKDTVADYLVEKYGYRKVGFANKLKESIAALFDITVEDIEYLKNNMTMGAAIGQQDSHNNIIPLFTGKPMPFRQLLQRYGTEAHREVFGEDFWVDQLLPLDVKQFDLLEVFPTVINDARFPNELTRVKSLSGINIRIARPGYGGEDHASEQLPPDGLIYTLIQNDGTIDLLQDRVDSMLIQWANSRDKVWTQSKT